MTCQMQILFFIACLRYFCLTSFQSLSFYAAYFYNTFSGARGHCFTVLIRICSLFFILLCIRLALLRRCRYLTEFILLRLLAYCSLLVFGSSSGSPRYRIWSAFELALFDIFLLSSCRVSLRTTATCWAWLESKAGVSLNS